jgi:hypothetical protein
MIAHGQTGLPAAHNYGVYLLDHGAPEYEGKSAFKGSSGQGSAAIAEVVQINDASPSGIALAVIGDLKRRGLSIGPELAIADGALGFWQALEFGDSSHLGVLYSYQRT